jgi:hypothetical protein
MKQTYFPYLPYSQNEDNKRYKYIHEIMEKNPFTYHKKKNYSSIFIDDNKFIPNNNFYSIQNEKNYDFISKNKLNGNNDLLLFQKANDKYMESYNIFMKNKSSIIESNAQNYLNYLYQNKKIHEINDKKKVNDDRYDILHNFKNQYSNELIGTKCLLQQNKSATNINTFNMKNINQKEDQKIDFIPNNIKTKGSDITNPFFYDHVAKEIIKKNQEVMDYNLKESENKYIKKRNKLKYLDDKLPLAPGKINNPNYYNLGESVLDKNPILNKGEYSPSFSRNYNYFSRQKNIFDI